MRSVATLATLALLLAGCAAPAASGPSAPPRTLTVFAAASLKGSFEELAAGFEAANPGVDVRVSFAGSGALVDQLQAGAPADVFAAADERTYARAHDAGLVGPGTLFATNRLTLVVESGNPHHVTGLDASLTGRRLVICAMGVPCGNATEALARDVGVTLAPVSQEQSVTDVLGKVASGQADVGVVYTTDAAAAGARVTAVPVAGAERHLNRYPIGVTASPAQAALAADFVAHVTGPAGRDVLATFGFGTP